MFVVCMCARFQSAPKELHFNAGKRILKYLQGTKDVGLWYPGYVSLSLTWDPAYLAPSLLAVNDTRGLVGTTNLQNT